MKTLSTVPVDVVLLPERCYRCGQPTSPVVGLWFARDTIDGEAYDITPESGGWFLAYDEMSADVIAAACPDELLAAHGAGPLRWRTTRICPDGYLANTCAQCGTVMGNWPLHEALVEHRAEGGTLGDLPHIPTQVAGADLERL